MTTKAKGIRLEIKDIESIEIKARKQGLTFNKWVNWAIKKGLEAS